MQQILPTNYGVAVLSNGAFEPVEVLFPWFDTVIGKIYVKTHHCKEVGWQIKLLCKKAIPG